MSWTSAIGAIVWTANHWQDFALVATTLITAASLVVKLTPTPADDAAVAKARAWLEAIAMTPKITPRRAARELSDQEIEQLVREARGPVDLID